ncbi:hypothetical protein OROHE_018641 [Orobanche hederae]
MRLLKKCGKRVDKINELSDDIILHILSFIPTADACDAGLVCRRWFHLWGCIPKLTFKFPYYKGISQIIPHIERALSLTLALNSHKALSFSYLQEFKLDFRVPKKFQHLVSRWLAYAFSRGVERLHLNLGDDGAIFDKHMLKEIASFEPLNLKVLVLRCIMMKGDALELLLPNCPLLERLHICRPMRSGGGLKKREIMVMDEREEFKGLDLLIDGAVIDSPSLKHLDMRSRSFKSVINPTYIHDYSIRVCAPNLTWLTIDQNSKGLFLERVPKLAHMHFFYRSELGDSMHHFVNVAAQLQTLIIHLFNPKEAFSVPGMPKLKKLVVYFRTNWNKVSLPVTRFISASPCLEEFRLEISELYFSGFRKPPRVPVDIFEVPKAPSPHSHLKRFVFSGYRGVRRCGDKDLGYFDVTLELVRFVVDNCVALDEIVIGKCHPVGLVSDIVDYGEESLDHIIMDPAPPFCKRYVATFEERRAFEKVMQRQQIPAHNKLHIVYEVDT